MCTLDRPLGGQNADGIALKVQARVATDDTAVFIVAEDSPFVTDSVLIALGADGAQTRFFANDVVRREAPAGSRSLTGPQDAPAQLARAKAKGHDRPQIGRAHV